MVRTGGERVHAVLGQYDYCMHQGVQRMITLLIRRLWTMHKKILIDDGAAKQELLLAQDAFYNGARSVLKVLAHMLEHGEIDELHHTIVREGRQIDVIQRSGRRARRH